MAGDVACMGERRGVYRVLVGKPEGKRPLGRPRRRREDNIKMNFQDFFCGGISIKNCVNQNNPRSIQVKVSLAG